MAPTFVDEPEEAVMDGDGVLLLEGKRALEGITLEKSVEVGCSSVVVVVGRSLVVVGVGISSVVVVVVSSVVVISVGVYKSVVVVSV